MRQRNRKYLLALVCAFACSGAVLPLSTGSAWATPFDARGMWIWYVDRSDGGIPAAIIARAHAAGVRTLFIKAGDGSTYWSQFSPQLVSALRSGGLQVCAWQYVYGSDPVAEADVAARAAANGAQCLAIDAEAEYEGRYASAQTYIRTLRAAVGYRFPVGLASFPYVNYHPAFPFSVFLGPGGAQYNVPQMYWAQIGSGVETVYRHTYRYNRIYGRAIAPLGETDSGATGSDALLFRGLDVRYGAPGISWWDYAWTSASGLWSSISGYYTVVSWIVSPGYPYLHVGSKGDAVVRLQEMLAGAYSSTGIDGDFGPATQANLESLQRAHGLTVTGTTTTATWHVLRRYTPVVPSWSGTPAASPDGLVRGRRRVARAPLSAGLPAVRDEIVLEPQRAEAARLRR